MRNIASARRIHGSLWLPVLLAVSPACDDGSPTGQQAQTGSVMSLAGALSSAVSACAETARACEAQAADAAGPSAACHDAFGACQDAAKEASKPQIDHAVNACADAAKTCRAGATTSDAKSACGDQLATCLGEREKDAGQDDAKPDAGSKRDGGTEASHESPVATCIGALHTCIEGDQPARTCTSALQDCIASSVGHNGGGEADGGKPAHDADAGKPERDDDAGKPERDDDAGKPERDDDAGKPDMPHADAAQQDHGDAGRPDPNDAGNAADAKACKEAQDACIASGMEHNACARMLKLCRDN